MDKCKKLRKCIKNRRSINYDWAASTSIQAQEDWDTIMLIREQDCASNWNIMVT